MRVGILGAARIAPIAMTRPAQAVAGVELACIAARDPGRARAFAAAHGVARAEPDYAGVIAATDVDLVYNALPIDAHAHWSIRALEAGKHVLCEKPLAMNAAQAGAMQGAAEASGRLLIEAFHCRYHPAHDQVAAWLSQGRVGAVRGVRAVFNTVVKATREQIRYQPARGGGAMMDLGCYPVLWALSALDGEPDTVEADARLAPSGVDVAMQARLTFADGAVADLSCAMDAPSESRLEIEGAAGRIVFENPLAPHNGGRLTLTSAEGRLDAPISRVTTYAHQLAAVAAAVDGGLAETAAALPTQGAAMLRQQRTLDRIYAAAGLAHLRAAQP